MMKKISFVIPVFEEGRNVFDNIECIISYTKDLNYDFEFVIVDDGSMDNTWIELQKLSFKYSFVRVIQLSRNFGKEAALCAGLDNISGDACIIMDSDLQHPPSLIPTMISYWEEGYEVVEGVKTDRGQEKFIYKTLTFLYYRTLNKLTGTNLTGASDFKLLDKIVVDSWRNMRERVTFFRGMSAWQGYNRKQVSFNVAQRSGGNTKWSIKALFSLAKNSITSYSTVPLHFITAIGFFFLLGAIILFFQTLYQKLSGNAVSGFTTVIILLLVTGSLLMISIGIIGEYIARIYEEVKMRPRYLIREITNGNKNETRSERYYEYQNS